MTINQPDRLDRIEQLLERVVQIQERVILTQEQQQGQVQILLNAATDHATRIARQDALIERLDTIIERMVYREGRDGDNNQPQP